MNVVVESQVVGKEGTGGATEATGDDHDLVRREVHSRFDLITEASARVEVYETGVVPEVATANVGHAREEVAGVIVGNVIIGHVIVVGRTPDGGLHTAGSSGVDAVHCQWAKGKILRTPAYEGRSDYCRIMRKREERENDRETKRNLKHRRKKGLERGLTSGLGRPSPAAAGRQGECGQCRCCHLRCW